MTVREHSDDMGINYSERWLVECKHYAKSDRSVKETDLGNIEMRMKRHKATHYLLITSTVASETVSQQLKAISDDPTTIHKATFWTKHDLTHELLQYKDIHDKYLWSWEKQAKQAVNLLRKHHFSAHRGAILWCPNVVAVFENRRGGNRQSLQKIRDTLRQRNFVEFSAFQTDDEQCWVILVKSNDVRELDEIAWDGFPPEDIYTIYQRKIAFGSIWSFFYKPVNETC